MSAVASVALQVSAAANTADSTSLSVFGNDPWWLILLKAGFIFVFLVLMTLFTIWLERRVVARMQMRVGPNRVGPFGLIQGLADGIKLALKEDIIPKAVDKPVFILAPIISCVPAFLGFAVIPFGPEVSIFGHRTALQLTDFPIAVLYVIAIASIGIYGIVLAGWSSGSTYPLLGGLRSTAQMISYEVAMSLSFVAVFPSFAIYAISMVGETNRAPFDLPEAEGELVGGFHTEYSSLKFALFFLAEYVNMVTVSALATTLFLGGYRAPWPITAVWPGNGSPNEGWWPMLWFIGKLFAFIFVFIWLRGTLPRLQYDQFMKLGWKFLIPVSLGWILLVATVRAFQNEGYDVRQWTFVGAGVVLLLLVVAWVWAGAAERREREAAEARAEAAEQPFDPFAGGHPVPPLPGQEIVREPRVPVTVGAGATDDTQAADILSNGPDQEAPRG